MPLRYNMAEMNWVSLQFDIHILYNEKEYEKKASRSF